MKDKMNGNENGKAIKRPGARLGSDRRKIARGYVREAVADGSFQTLPWKIQMALQILAPAIKYDGPVVPSQKPRFLYYVYNDGRLVGIHDSMKTVAKATGYCEATIRKGVINNMPLDSHLLVVRKGGHE